MDADSFLAWRRLELFLLRRIALDLYCIGTAAGKIKIRT